MILYSRNRKLVFPSSLKKTRVEVWEKEKCCGSGRALKKNGKNNRRRLPRPACFITEQSTVEASSFVNHSMPCS